MPLDGMGIHIPWTATAEWHGRPGVATTDLWGNMLRGLVDVDTTAFANGAVFFYNSTTDMFELRPIVAGDIPSHTHVLANITDAGTAAGFDVPASGDAAIGEVVKGDDTRLTDARTPTAHTHVLVDITDAGTAAGFDVPSAGNAAVGEVVKGDDTRLTDARTPTSHTHPLSELTQSGASTGQYAQWNGSFWVPVDLPRPTLIKAVTVKTPAGSTEGAVFFTMDALTISQLTAVLVGSSTPSVSWTLRHSTDRSATGNEVITAGSTTTSTTTGHLLLSFNDATVPASSFIWIEFAGVSGTVDEFHLSIEYTLD